MVAASFGLFVALIKARFRPVEADRLAPRLIMIGVPAIRLNNKLSALAGVVATGDYRPTAQAEAVYAEITAKIDAELKTLQQLFGKDLDQLNETYQTFMSIIEGRYKASGESVQGS